MPRQHFGLMLAVGLALLDVYVGHASACTGIRIKAADGSVIYARTMEFGLDMHSRVVIIPRGTKCVGTLPNKQPGIAWETKYGVVGANGFGIDLVIEGLNEKGLGAGIFLFPGYAGFPEATSADTGRGLAPWELVHWLLTNFATVGEARSALDQVRVCAVVQEDMGAVPPVHFVVHDAAGDCIVIEYIKGVCHVYDNPLGVITNAPSFDWHLTNLDNYVNLSATNVPQLKLDGMTIEQLGQGSGLLRMPGDFTPPSRFVRAVTLTQSAKPAATAEEGVSLAAHVLNSFDIIRGLVRNKDQGQEMLEITAWTSYNDLTSKAFYFRTYGNHRIRKVDLTKIDFTQPGIRSLPMDNKEAFEDLTSQAK